MPLPEASAFPRLIQTGQQLSDELASRSRKGTTLLRKFLAQVRLASAEVLIDLHAHQLASLLQLDSLPESATLTLSAAATLKRRGGGLKLVMPGGRRVTPNVNLPLLQLIQRGRQWWQELQTETELTLEAIGRREGLTGGYVVRLVRLAFLNPAILVAILDGHPRVQLTSDALTGPEAIRPRWADHQCDFRFLPAS